MTKKKAKAETLPPVDTAPKVAPMVTVSAERFPAIVRALNLIREDNGGPSWPPEAEPEVAKHWESFLHSINDTLAGLSDERPAGEDPEPLDGFLGSELYTFCNGESAVVEAMKSRGHSTEIAHHFLNDFFEGWTRGVPEL